MNLSNHQRSQRADMFVDFYSSGLRCCDTCSRVNWSQFIYLSVDITVMESLGLSQLVILNMFIKILWRSDHVT